MTRRKDHFKPCTIEGCNKPLVARGWCLKHYSRWKRQGDPNKLLDESPLTRFWKRVDKEGPLYERLSSRCWRWTGYVFSIGGYGGLALNNSIVLAHRFSWEVHRGAIPEDKMVLHQCDNRLCVSPKHLFLGNARINMDDKVKKERQARGETNGRAILTEEQVKEIRSIYAQGSTSYRLLAYKYRVDNTTIAGIIRRRLWKHI